MIRSRLVYRKGVVNHPTYSFRILEIPIGYACNNNCIHCNFADKKSLNRTTEECKKIMDDQRTESNALILSGGEPTIRNDIFDLISYARNTGYRWIQLKTNGRMFYYKDFTEKIVNILKNNPVVRKNYTLDDEIINQNFGDLDIFEFVISLHGHTPELHDSITKVKNSFEQTIEGIKNLLHLNQAVVVNVTITKLNYKYLPEIAKLLKTLGAGEIDFIFPKHDNLKDFQEMVPKITDVQPSLFKALDELSIKSKVDNKLINALHKAFVSSIPVCCIRGYEGHFSQFYYPIDQHEMYKLMDINSVTTYYDKRLENTKGTKCVECIYEPVCIGIEKEYAETYGTNELNPVSGKVIKNIEEVRNSINLNLSDVKFDSYDFDLKANAISLFSGGVDSTLAAFLYAKDNIDEKVILITFDDGLTQDIETTCFNAKLLMEKQKNIIEHLVIPIPRIILKKLIFDSIEDNHKKFKYYPTCDACRFIRISYCIYLLKKYFGGDTIIDGYKSSEYGEIEKELESFLCEYGIKNIHPVHKLKKDMIFNQIKRNGLNIELARTGCIILNPIRSFHLKYCFNDQIFDYREDLKSKLRVILENSMKTNHMM